MNRLVPAAVIGFSLLASLHAQQQPEQANGQAGRIRAPFALWKAELPGGSYLVARNAISAVSMQQYVLDGVANVTEVNVTTNGNFHPRFYFLEMIDAAAAGAKAPGGDLASVAALAAAKEAVEMADSDATGKVVKNYPATTHAGTIEFRLPTAAAVQKLYESVTRTWLTGESEAFTLTGTRRITAAGEITPADDAQSDQGPGTNGGGMQ
jgi:hypothetical protein